MAYERRQSGFGLLAPLQLLFGAEGLLVDMDGLLQLCSIDQLRIHAAAGQQRFIHPRQRIHAGLIGPGTRLAIRWRRVTGAISLGRRGDTASRFTIPLRLANPEILQHLTYLAELLWLVEKLRGGMRILRGDLFPKLFHVVGLKILIGQDEIDLLSIAAVPGGDVVPDEDSAIWLLFDQVIPALDNDPILFERSGTSFHRCGLGKQARQLSGKVLLRARAAQFLAADVPGFRVWEALTTGKAGKLGRAFLLLHVLRAGVAIDLPVDRDKLVPPKQLQIHAAPRAGSIPLLAEPVEHILHLYSEPSGRFSLTLSPGIYKHALPVMLLLYWSGLL